MKTHEEFTAKQVGERIRERRTDLRLSMSQLGDRLGVNKSTIQRYEASGVDPEKTYMMISLAEALETTPEWLTGKSEAKEYDSYTKCKKDIDPHIIAYLDELTRKVKDESHQQMLTTFLGGFVDLYSILCCHFARAMDEADSAAEDEGLKESIRRYAIEIGDITQRVYRREMEAPVDDMKRFLDGLLHLYDEGKERTRITDLLNITYEAREKLNNSEPVAP